MIDKKENLERHFNECLEASSGHDMHVAFIDFNNFKKINDTLGHEVGDFVIDRVSTILVDNTRRNKDRIIRNGGDEFVIILPKCNEAQANEIIDRVSSKISSDKQLIDKLGRQFTVSIGCVPHDHTRHKEWKDAIRDADKLMYVAKRGGGPLYVMYSRSPEEIDLKTITNERANTITGMDRRDKFKYMFNYISRRNPELRRELLVKALRVVWSSQKDDIIDAPESRIMGAILENYRFVEAEFNERMKKLEDGKLSEQELKDEYDVVKQAREEEARQAEDEKKLLNLDTQLEEAKELDFYAKVKEKSPKSLQELKKNNQTKHDALKDRLAEQKRQNELKRAEWALKAAERAETQAKEYRKQYEDIMKQSPDEMANVKYGVIIHQDVSGKRKVMRG